MYGRRVFAAIFAVMMVLGTAGCGRTASQERFVPALDTQKEVEINVCGGWDNFEALDQVGVDFQKYYPGVEIVYTKLEDYAHDLKNKLITGEDIDIFMMDWWGYQDSGYYEEVISNAQDLYQTDIDISGFAPQYIENATVDGKLLALPVYESTAGLLMNQSLLAENNIEIPATWDEFVSSCDTLKEKGYEPILAHNDYLTKFAVNEVMLRIVNNEEKEKVLAGLRAGKDSDGIIRQTQELIESLGDAGYISSCSSGLEDNYNAVIMKFFEGDTPYVIFYANNVSGTRKREAKSGDFQEEPFTYGFYPVPGQDGPQAFYLNCHALYFCVYKNSANLEYVNEFMRFLAMDEEMKTLAAIKNLQVATENSDLALFAGFDRLDSRQKHYSGENGLTINDERFLYEVFSGYRLGQTTYDELLEALSVQSQTR